MPQREALRRAGARPRTAVLVGAVTAAEDVSVYRLRVGDCLITPADGVVDDLAAVPCDREHDGEVFHAFDLPLTPVAAER